MIIYLVGFVCLYLLLILGKFLYKEWWTPIRIQSLMRSQGIKGPSYRFHHGNTKEIANMRKETMKSPTELSHYILPRLQPHMYSWIKVYGKNFLLWYGVRAQLVVTEPELVKEMLINSKEETFSVIAFQEYIKKLLGDGLVLSTGEKWIKMRKLANLAFHSESLKGMLPAMIASVEMMLDGWKHHERKEIEVFQEFKVLTSDIISRTAFGSSYLEGERIFELLKRMIGIIAKKHYKVRIPGIGRCFKTSDDVELDKLQQEIRKIIIKMVKRRETAAKTGETDCYGSDLLGLLVKAYKDEDKNKKISMDDMVDECKNFYAAGQETTASSLSWTMLLLAIHTDWQLRARLEVLEVFGQQNPTADGIARLKTMGMIINESLRLYPPVLHTSREVQREVRLGKLVIPAKIETYIPTLALHTDYQIWGEDAHLFGPERFAEGVAKATKNSISSFLPFGLGPRTCVGLNFAITEMKVALSMILQRYRCTLSPTYVHSPVQILTMCPQLGVPIILEEQ